MKELSIEEKVKRYDEAIEIARQIHDADRVSGIELTTCEEIFPELAESENERIRKEIINYFEHYPNIIVKRERKRDWIAWLERQGEITKEWSEMKVANIHKELQEMVDLKQKIEQGEQKPAEWDILSAKKGDMLSNGTIVLIVDSIGEFEGRPIINSWYFADSEKFYGKGTSECDRWEVDGFRTATEAECNYLLKMMADTGYVWDTNKLELMEIEQKPAWSEEDEKLVKNLISTLSNLYARNLIEKETKEKYTNLLKSLRPQNRWKPSERQIYLLNWVANILLKDDGIVEKETAKELQQLLEQLKKL